MRINLGTINIPDMLVQLCWLYRRSKQNKVRASLVAIGVAIALNGCASNGAKPGVVGGPPLTCAELSSPDVPKPDGPDETVAILAAGYSDGTFVPIKSLAEASGKRFSQNAKLQDFAIRSIWLTWCRPGRPDKNRTFVSHVVIPFSFSKSRRPSPGLPETQAN